MSLEEIRAQAKIILENAFNDLEVLIEEYEGPEGVAAADQIAQVQSQLTDWKEVFNDN